MPTTLILVLQILRPSYGPALKTESGFACQMIPREIIALPSLSRAIQNT